MEFNIQSMMEKSLKTYTETVVQNATKYLSSEYGFVDNNNVKDFNNVKDLPTIPFPFTGTIKSDWCGAMKQNYGLYSQCTSPKTKDSDLCKTCKNQEDKKGQTTHGYIQNRVEGIQGKKVSIYSMVLKKMGITQEDAMAEAAKYGITLTAEEFKVPEKTRGRPKKEVETKPKEVAARGRPKKEKKVVSANTADNLIASLVAQAQLLKPKA
jgi:hypothetical protein